MKFHTSESSVPDVDMTPMIDIVFQLIAFFMVITNFEQNKADERVRLPKDQLAIPQEVKPKHSVTLNLGYDRDPMTGEIINPTPLMFYTGDKLEPRDWAKPLAQEAQFFEALDVDLAEVAVEIRSDGDIPTGLVQELIQSCQNARGSAQSTEGFQRFTFKATQKTE